MDEATNVLPAMVEKQIRRERGTGSIFKPKFKDKKTGEILECQHFYISYYWHGRRYVESAKSDRVTVARELLKRRLGDMSSGRFVGPNIERTTFKDLAELIVSDYANNKFRSMVRLKRSLGFLDKFFGKRRAVDVDSAKVAAYITERLSVGAANATVNRELSTLKRMFSLGVREKKVSLASVPSIRLLKERNARKGFVEHDQYLSLRNELPEYLKPILAFLYYTGVRDGEALALKWNSVDLAEREIRIEADATKNDEGKTLPLDGELLEILKIERAIRDSKYRVCEWVFHRSGKRLQSFYKAWHTACVKAGLGRIECPQCSKTVEGSLHCPVCQTRVRYVGLIPHDLRRTAIRNMVRAGVPESVAMKISGHATRSVFDRYDITSKRAARRLSKYLESKNSQTLAKAVASKKLAHSERAVNLVN